MGLRDRLRRLEEAAEENLITFELEDGTVARFAQEAYMECLLHEIDRGRKHLDGEDLGPAHPLVEALRQARNLDALTREYGTLLAAFVDEDAIMRGEMEQPGPPVEETSPGVYE